MIRCTSNIDSIIARVTAYRDSLPEMCRLIITELISAGEIIARSEVISLGAVYTGALANSIDHYYDEATRTGFVRCNSEYGIFVEFGTGVVGKEHPYSGRAMAAIGYRYGGGTTYVQTSDGRVGWYYPADDGTWRFTEGQPSRPFMYNTAQLMKRQVTTVARQVFVGA